MGGKWSLWVGLILTLFAASFGLAYGWSYIGPAGRVGLGVAVGLVFLTLSEFARRRTEKWYAEGLAAGGIALLYLSIWAAAAYYHLIGTVPGFGAMALVTAAGLTIAIRLDARSLMLLASIGGYLTPVLLQEAGGFGGDSALYFWLYVTALNAGVLGSAAYKRWREVRVVAFVASVLLLGGWIATRYSAEMMAETFGFLTVNYLIFTGICSAYSLRYRVAAAASDVALLASAGPTAHHSNRTFLLCANRTLLLCCYTPD